MSEQCLSRSELTALVLDLSARVEILESSLRASRSITKDRSNLLLPQEVRESVDDPPVPPEELAPVVPFKRKNAVRTEQGTPDLP